MFQEEVGILSPTSPGWSLGHGGWFSGKGGPGLGASRAQKGAGVTGCEANPSKCSANLKLLTAAEGEAKCLGRLGALWEEHPPTGE